MVKSFVKIDGPDNSSVYGENVNGYPRHHFYRLKSFKQPESCALQISSGGKDEHCQGVWRTRENSPLLSLELVTSGIFEFTQENCKYNCSAGTLFMVRPSCTSTMKTITPFSTKLTLIYSGKALIPLLSAMGLDQCDVIENAAPVIESEMLKAVEILRSSSEKCDTDLPATAFKILHLLSMQYNKKVLPSPLEEAVKYLEENFAQNITVKMLSQKFNISPRSLFRLFKNHIGSTPIHYLTTLRMHRARILLASKMSVKEVANAVGYNSALYFSNEFKRHCKTTPSEYKKANQVC